MEFNELMQQFAAKVGLSELTPEGDGVTEAERADHEQYGEKRLLEFAAAHAKDAPGGFVAGMEQAINAFTSGAEQSDDITAIAIRVDGRGAN